MTAAAAARREREEEENLRQLIPCRRNNSSVFLQTLEGWAI
jgi:hypothetical protein